MVDSGADHTVIPFSIGSLIGLEPPTQTEILQSVTGVGGNITCIERPCCICLANRKKGNVYYFKETVTWLYPDIPTQEKLQDLLNKLKKLEEWKLQCVPGELQNNVIEQIEESKTQINNILNKFEVNVLLGRPFFDNFNYIQFFHRDRNREDQCFLTYMVNNTKPARIIPIDESVYSV